MKRAKDMRPRLRANLLIEVPVPKDLMNVMSELDRDYLESMTRNKIFWVSGESLTMVFHLEDIGRLRNMFSKYERVIAFPSSAHLQEYGLKHSSGDSLYISVLDNAFVCTQFFPDGVTKVYIIPKDDVFYCLHIIQDHFALAPEPRIVRTPVIWEAICRAKHLNQFFDNHGQFHKESFNGTRGIYNYHFYLPCKVLASLRLIYYHGPRISLEEFEVEQGGNGDE